MPQYATREIVPGTHVPAGLHPEKRALVRAAGLRRFVYNLRIRAIAVVLGVSSFVPLIVLLAAGTMHSSKAAAEIAPVCSGQLWAEYLSSGILPPGAQAPGSAVCKLIAAQDCATYPSSQVCYQETIFAEGIMCTNYSVFPPTGCGQAGPTPVFVDPNAGQGSGAYHTDHGSSLFVAARGDPAPALQPLTYWQQYMESAATDPLLTLDEFNTVRALNQPGVSVNFADNSPTFDDNVNTDDGVTSGSGALSNDYPSAPADPSSDPISDVAPNTGTGSGDTNNVCCTGVGDPINSATGNLFEVQRDFVGLGPLPIRYLRFYNSLLQVNALAKTELGTGWRGSYDSAISVVSGQSAPTAVVVRPDGQSLTFTNPTGGQWVPSDPTVRAVLSSSNDSSGNVLGWTYVTADDFTESYNASGQLLSIANRAGLKQTLSYNSSGQLASVADPYGHQLLLAYNTQGQLIQTTDPGGGTYQYAYDGNNNLVSVTYPDRTTRQYLYENTAFPNALTGLIDENGSRLVTWTYDSQGRATSSAQAGGVQAVSITYNADGSSSVTDARGTVRLHSFASIGAGALRPTSTSVQNCTTSCPGVTSRANYDSNGVFTSGIDPNGNTTALTYNARGLLTSRTEAVGIPLARTVNVTWHSVFHLPVQITFPDRVVTFVYDSSGNRISKTVTAGGVSRTWSYAYNAQGLLTQLTGPRTDVAQVWNFAYDTQGHLTRIQDPLGHVTQFPAYDAYGHPLSMLDPNGVSASLTFDARGRLTSRSIGARTWTYQRDAAGQVIGVTYPNGESVAFSFDAAHRLTDVRYGSVGILQHRALTAASDVTQTQLLDGNNNVVRQRSYAVDGFGRIVSTTDANGQTSTLAYDQNGNPTASTDSLGRTSSIAYDALNRATSVIDTLGDTSSVQYNLYDQPVQITAGNGAVTQYTYDAFRQLLQEISPDRGITTITYSAAGLPTSRADARGVIAGYTFDALNRPTRIAFSTPSKFAGAPLWLELLDPSIFSDDVSYTYDQGTGCTNGIGRLCARQDQSGIEHYSYDAFGEVTQQTQAIFGLNYSTQYIYDAAGHLTQETYPDGRIVSYTRDAFGRISGIQGTVNHVNAPILSAMQYRADGAATSLTFGNGLTETRGYDPVGRLISQVVGSLDTRSYAFDAVGNLTSKQTSAESDQFSYDALNRLVGEQRRQGSTTANNAFIYDPSGNRLSETRDGAVIPLTYSPNSNQLIQLGSASLRLDPVGNTTSDGVHQFHYSAAGFLQWVGQDGIPIAGYLYNATGQRTGKLTLQGISLYHYDVFGRLISETTVGSQPSRDYIWSGSTPVAQINHWLPIGSMITLAHCAVGSDGKIDWVTYLQTDGNGTPRIGTDIAQNMVWRWDGEAFGESVPLQSAAAGAYPVEVNLRNAGQYFDDETGLFYNGARYYSPQVGRYISSDPIGLRGGLNTYAYVLNSPLRYIDPSGQMPTTPPYYTPLEGFIGELAEVTDIFYPVSLALPWIGAAVTGGAIGVGLGVAINYTACGSESCSDRLGGLANDWLNPISPPPLPSDLPTQESPSCESAAPGYPPAASSFL